MSCHGLVRREGGLSWGDEKGETVLADSVAFCAAALRGLRGVPYAKFPRAHAPGLRRCAALRGLRNAYQMPNGADVLKPELCRLGGKMSPYLLGTGIGEDKIATGVDG